MTPLRRIAVLAGTIALAGFGRAADPIDSIIDRNPVIPVPKIVDTYPAGMANLWIEALGRPDAETKTAAAQSIAFAHRQGMPGLAAAASPLVRELDRPGQHPTARLAAAHALVALDAKQAADAFTRHMDTDDPELREVIEPALARWDHRPARAVWLERIGQAPPYRRQHVLAAIALGTVREEKAAPKLRTWSLSPTLPAPVRLEAARALGRMTTTGLEKDAAALVAAATPRDSTPRLLAASLLRHHEGDAAVRLLLTLGQDTEPTVAAVALARLVEIDPKHVLAILESVLASPDANVRAVAVEALFRVPTEANLHTLADRFLDPHPANRERAREALRELAGQAEWKGAVIREGMRMLTGGDWLGHEQAALLLGQLDHKPAAGRLVELLRAERPEAFVAAAWALRKLAVADTLPAVLAFLRGEHTKMLASGPTAGRKGVKPVAVDRQTTQLVQFLGISKFQPADATLRAMLPRIVPGQPGSPPASPVGTETRTAVAWALGLLHEGKPQADVVRLLEERVADAPKPGLGGEHQTIRATAAVALGRMKSTRSVPTLQKFVDPLSTLDPLSNSCRWALAQLSGEPLPPPGVIERGSLGWFLTPIH